jgi:poly-beta-1,6-N-acetyl-D-glucosamine synthase
MIKKDQFAFLVPAHNEEKVIGKTLESLLKITSPKHIYVVDDGSVDNTYQVVRKYTKNVLSLHPNVGKAQAMNSAIKKFNLAKKYRFITPIDADSKVDKKYLDEVIKVFEKDTKRKLACVVGKVIGRNHNWITLYRCWEYEVAQTVHKQAQSYLNGIIVCPGPSTTYRAEVFKKMQIPEDTLTEDMDFTFSIHRNNLGKIKYHAKAQVVTQDPKTIKDFAKQLDRWYTGLWQCIKKHNLPWGGQMLDVEIGILATEGLYNGILMVTAVLLLPLILIKSPTLLLWPFLIDLCLFVIPTLIYTSLKIRSVDFFVYLPMFYFMRVLSSLVFIESFLKVVLGIDLTMGWFKATRYSLEGSNLRQPRLALAKTYYQSINHNIPLKKVLPKASLIKNTLIRKRTTFEDQKEIFFK